MVTTDELAPELTLAFTCLAAVGSSMIRRFRIEDAKACTRVCRRILLCAGCSTPHEVTDNICELTCIDAISAAALLLTRRLLPLDDPDTKYLSIAQAAIASLRQDLTSNATVTLLST